LEIARLVLDFLSVLAWPAVALLGILLFRGHVADLVRRIKGAGLPGGISLDFDREVQAAQQLSSEVLKAVQVAPNPGKPILTTSKANARMLDLDLQPSPSGLQLSRYTELTRQDPNLALAGLRMEIEVLARNLAKGFNIDVDPHASPGALLQRLREGEALTRDQYALAQKIVQLCNAAVHGRPVTQDEALAVIESAEVLASYYVAWLSWGFKDGSPPKPEPGH
jgi:hypothetical protein